MGSYYLKISTWNKKDISSWHIISNKWGDKEVQLNKFIKDKIINKKAINKPKAVNSDSLLIHPLNPIFIIKKSIINLEHINIKTMCIQIPLISMDKTLPIKDKLTIFTDKKICNEE